MRLGTREPPLLQAHVINEVSVLTGNKVRMKPPAPRSHDEKELEDILPLHTHSTFVCVLMCQTPN